MDNLELYSKSPTFFATEAVNELVRRCEGFDPTVKDRITAANIIKSWIDEALSVRPAAPAADVEGLVRKIYTIPEDAPLEYLPYAENTIKLITAFLAQRTAAPDATAQLQERVAKLRAALIACRPLVQAGPAIHSQIDAALATTGEAG